MGRSNENCDYWDEGGKETFVEVRGSDQYLHKAIEVCAPIGGIAQHREWPMNRGNGFRQASN